MPRQSKQPKRHYEKPLSLWPLTLEQIVERAFKYKPTKPKKKSGNTREPTPKVAG